MPKKPTIEAACERVLENIATNIRVAREKRDWTRRHLSRVSGVDEDALQKIELQQRLPRVETLVRIARTLDTDVAVLVGAPS